jgi:hypothetical protein
MVPMKLGWRAAVCTLAAATGASAIEIATGKMLGSGYDQRAFYLRQDGGAWVKTYTGPGFRPEAPGKLMNLRVGQALYHDEWLTEESFDPETNTARVVEALDDYKAHGILAISVSLQGANQAYERTPNIKRGRDAKLGPGKGALMSAYRPDGSLKDAWLKRALNVIREADKRGMIVNLMYFYAHQDEIFTDTAAIDRAVINTTDWLVANNLRNVIIEIANEHNIKAFDHDGYIDRSIGKLIALARSRFKPAFRVPITASTAGMRVFPGVRENADLIAIHGNNRTPEEKRKAMAELLADASLPGPIYMNEDNNGRETTTANLASELASCDVMFEMGQGWGYMPWVQLQVYPFRHYRPGKSASVADNMDPAERDPAYFKAVLNHIRSLVYRAN